MKTIIVCTTNYYPFIGGAEVAVEEIARRLNNDFRFVIITARSDRKLPYRENRPEGMVLRIGWGTRFDKWILACAGGIIIALKLTFGEWKYLRRRHECVLWGVDISQGACAAAITSFFLPRIPFVLNLQYGYGDLRLSSGRLGAIRIAFRRMLARADYVTAISTYLLDIARQYHYRDSASIIPNGVDFEKFVLQGEKKPHAKPTVITLSRLVYKNGIDILIRSIAKLKKEIPDIQCCIIGDGPERKHLELLTSQLNVKDNVIFFGSIPNSGLPAYLHNADVFVRPSRSEGMGIAFVEALAAGLPVIGTPVGGIPDIIVAGKTGIFANVDDVDDLADKIKQTLNNKSLSRTIVSEGQKMVQERFSWKAITEQYKNIFSIVISARRVVIAAPLYPPDIGGPATYVHTLGANLWKHGILPRIEYFGAVRRFPKIIRHTVYGIKICFKVRGKDAIFAQDPVSTGFPAMIAAKIMRKKFFLKIVGDYAWEQWQQDGWQKEFINPEQFQRMPAGWKTEMRRAVERSVARRADTIIVPSRYLKKIVMLWGVPDKKIFVVPNAFETWHDPEEFLKKRNRSSRVLISAGRLVPWKGFETLIRLIPRIQKNFFNCRLQIIGDGPMRAELQELVQSLHLENSVVIQGPFPHQFFLDTLYAGEVFVLNTGYEGMSHVLLEAMAAGVPVVTTDVCGNPEVIENGKEGLLVAYNDEEALYRAVVSLLGNQDLREKIIKNAKEKVKEFSGENMIMKTKELLLR